MPPNPTTAVLRDLESATERHPLDRERREARVWEQTFLAELEDDGEAS